MFSGIAKKVVRLLVAVFMVYGVSGCSSGDNDAEHSGTEPSTSQSENGKESMGMEITSPAFGHNERIPVKYTGEGEDVSPELVFENVPDEAKELALICDDPDAPGKTWVHWVIYKIPAETKGLPAGVKNSATLPVPPGAMQGVNSWGSLGYGGPHPPAGHGVHHYHFKLYALDRELDVKTHLEKEALLQAMEGHIIAQAELTGTYDR